MNLARRFNAGIRFVKCSRRVATIEFRPGSNVATRRGHCVWRFPALKGRAKFTPTLRVENPTANRTSVILIYETLDGVDLSQVA